MKVCVLIPGNMIGGGVKVMVRLASYLAEWDDVTLMYPIVPHYTLNHILKRSSARAKILQVACGIFRRKRDFLFRADLASRVHLKTYFTTLHESLLQGFNVVIYPSVWQFHELKNISFSNLKRVHWSLADYVYCSGLDQPLDHIFTAYASDDVIVAPSSSVQLLLQNYGINVRATIPGGIDSLFHPKGRAFPGDPPRILGYFQPSWWVKGGATLLQVLIRLRKKYPHIPITLFGHQKSLIAESGSAICDRFLTGLSSEQVADLCRAHDIFLYPSYSDGFQSPPLEAMACGCAVVMTRVGAAEEYGMHERNALIVLPMDPDGMYAQVERLIHDHSLRERLSQQAPIDTAKWTWENCAEQFHQLMTELV